MSSAPPSLPPLDDTFGALFLGCVLCSMLYGMSVVQCLYYYMRTYSYDIYRRLLIYTIDRVRKRCLVSQAPRTLITIRKYL